ncbi:MAG: BTAD domain-containing putative transcriptional regulator [Caldilineaceae bacterium]
MPIVAPKVQALLAYLAMEQRRAHSRDRLSAFFWPDLPESAARNNLRQTLFVLRQNLGALAEDLLVASTRTVQWNERAAVVVDAVEFELRMDYARRQPNGQAEHLVEEALRCYRAPFLQGMGESGSDLFDEWMLMQRERLAQKALAALSFVTNEALRLEDFAIAQRHAQRQIEIDPLNEPAYRQLLLALSRSGDSTAALSHYENLVLLLRKELDVDPLPETVALAEKIRHERGQQTRKENGELLRKGGQIPRFAPSTLPISFAPLIGRKQEVEQLASKLTSPACRLLTLVGTAGVGKTRLALQIAQQLETTFAEGAHFVSLVDVNDPQQIPATLVRALSVPLQAKADLTTQLKSYLRPRQLLLVLDNFEQIVSGALLLAELQAAAPGLSLLVTSRERLRLPSEQVFAVQPLSLPDLTSSASRETIEETDAVQLFVAQAQTLKPGFALTEQNCQSVAQLCIRLDGLPLAIELVAARIRLLSPQKMLEQVATNVHQSGLLKSSASDNVARQRTLYASIDWSYHLLDPEEQRLFRLLAVFAGGACVEEICAVYEQDLAPHMRKPLPLSSEQEDVLSRLESLLDKSLVYYSENNPHRTGLSEPRVEMLVTIREYALQKSHEANELELLQARHATVYLEFARRNNPFPVPSSGKTNVPQLKIFERLRDEHANFQAALLWCFGDEEGHPPLPAHNPQLGIELLGALADSWFTRDFAQGIRWTNLAIAWLDANPTAVDRKLQADVYHSAGQMRFHHKPSHDRYRADAVLERAIAIYQEIAQADRQQAPMNRSIARSLTWLLHHHLDQRNRPAILQALRQLEAIDPAQIGGTGLVILARLAYVRQDLAQTLHWLGLAERHCNAQGDQINWAYAIYVEGMVALKEGDWMGGVPKLWQALNIMRQVQRKDIQMHLLSLLTEISLLRQDDQTLLTLAAEALPLTRDLHYDYGLAVLFLHVAVALLRTQPSSPAQQQERDTLIEALIAIADRLTKDVEPPDQQSALVYPRSIGYVCSLLGEERVTNMMKRGTVLSVDEAVASILCYCAKVN